MDLYNHSNPSFTKWIVSERLLSEPFVIIDIGVQGGEHPRWQFLGHYAEIHGFDPIAEVIDQLRRDARGSRQRHYHNLALGNEDGSRQFFLASDPLASSFYNAGPAAEERTVPIRRLDSLFREGLVPRADYIKLDCEGFEPEVLHGAREYLAASDVLCVTSETNFNFSPVLPRGHFAAINEIMADHRLIVYDVNLVRQPAAAYTLALKVDEQSSPNSLRGNSPLALGQIGTCDALFCRDFVGESIQPDKYRRNGILPRQPTADIIIKSMINFELHGLMDCAVDTAQHFRSLLAPRLNVDEAIARLLLPAPHPRNTADVTLARATQAAELETRFEAERRAFIARIRELETTIEAERRAFIARIRELESGTIRSALAALLRRLVRRYRLFRWLNEARKQLLSRLP
jgi:FkbM family methyltransferase